MKSFLSGLLWNLLIFILEGFLCSFIIIWLLFFLMFVFLYGLCDLWVLCLLKRGIWLGCLF